MKIEMTELERRAFNAYFRNKNNTEQPREVEELLSGGETYIALTNSKGILALYRHIPQRDVLKAMKNIPASIKEIYSGRLL